MATFCLIHGQWHDGSCWSSVGARLHAHGHQAVAPDLPFDDPSASYEDRARPALQAIDGVADPLVIVGHSIGSAEAALAAAARQPTLLVYLCPRFGSFAAPPDAPGVFREGFPFPPKDSEGRSVWAADAAVDVMYPRLPSEAANELARHLRPGAAAVGDYPLARHPDVPTALIYATDDEFFAPEWERFVANRLLDIEPIEIRGGHFPMVEDPDALTDLLIRLATDVTRSG